MRVAGEAAGGIRVAAEHGSGHVAEHGLDQAVAEPCHAHRLGVELRDGEGDGRREGDRGRGVLRA